MTILAKYKESLRYLKESRNHLLIVSGLFILTFGIGYFTPLFFVDAIRKLLENIINETEGMNFSQIFVFIFQNNLKTAFLGIILGIFLGVIPLFYAITNGYIIGFVASKASEAFGPSILLRLLPHGIFEIPALIISLALGIKFGTFFLTAKDKIKGFIAYLATGASTLIIFTLSLLFFGLISSFLTLEANLKQLSNNPSFLLLIIALFIVSFILGISIGLATLPKKEKPFIKENFKENFEHALETFLLIVLPLLLIAGFIESALIILFG